MKRKYPLPLPQNHKCHGCRYNYLEECNKLKKGEQDKCICFEWD